MQASGFGLEMYAYHFTEIAKKLAKLLRKSIFPFWRQVSSQFALLPKSVNSHILKISSRKSVFHFISPFVPSSIYDQTTNLQNQGTLIYLPFIALSRILDCGTFV